MSSLNSIIIVTLLLVCVSTSRGDYCEKMYKKCAFRFGFRKTLPTFKLMKRPNKAFTPRIRSKKFGRLVGTLQSNGMSPQFLFTKAGFPVSYFGKPRFSKDHFKPIALRSGGSAIAHEAFRGNNLEFARYRCIKVSFSSYTLLRTDGTVKKVVNNMDEKDNICVVFKTI